MQVTTGEEGFFGNGSSLVLHNPRDYPSNPNQYGSEWAQFVSMCCITSGSSQLVTVHTCAPDWRRQVALLLACCSLFTRIRNMRNKARASGCTALIGRRACVCSMLRHQAWLWLVKTLKAMQHQYCIALRLLTSHSQAAVMGCSSPAWDAASLFKLQKHCDLR